MENAGDYKPGRNGAEDWGAIARMTAAPKWPMMLCRQLAGAMKKRMQIVKRIIAVTILLCVLRPGNAQAQRSAYRWQARGDFRFG